MRHRQPVRGKIKGVIAALLVAILSAAPAVALDDSRWADIESQIQYGFYSEDLRALENLAAALAGGSGAPTDARAAYFAALAHYRLAEATRDRDRRAAGAAAARCAELIDAAPGMDADADALALSAACLALARSMQAIRLPLAGGSAAAALERAVKLAPRNPRVVLLDAVVAYERSSRGADRERVQHRFEEAARLFELERQGMSRTPGWGAAEAYGYLGRVYLDRGDAVAARGALERALLIAPDYLRARRLLNQIIG